MAERLIFHVDVNSAFLSWEAARREKGLYSMWMSTARFYPGKQRAA